MKGNVVFDEFLGDIAGVEAFEIDYLDSFA
jgi:hypothetical protein